MDSKSLNNTYLISAVNKLQVSVILSWSKISHNSMNNVNNDGLKKSYVICVRNSVDVK